MAGQKGIHIHLWQRRAAVGDLQPRDDLKIRHQGLSLGPAMRFDIADDHIHAFSAALMRSFEHGVSLADTGRVPQENLQPAARLLRLLRLNARQEFIGIRTGALVGHAASKNYEL